MVLGEGRAHAPFACEIVPLVIDHEIEEVDRSGSVGRNVRHERPQSCTVTAHEIPLDGTEPRVLPPGAVDMFARFRHDGGSVVVRSEVAE